MPLAVLALVAAAPTADAAWPGVNGRISITQRVPAGEVRANRDVFAYTRDHARTRVTTSTDNEEQSSWSPDGLWIAYKRREAVYVAPWDGSVAPRALTTPFDGDINNTQPAWSPDGDRIVFRTNRSETARPRRNVADVWVMDAPVGEPSARPLVERPGDERYPTFSPDGTRLLFRGDDDGLPNTDDEEILVANADGGAITALTDDAYLDSAPAWSPDGTRIAWESRRDGGGDREIFVMDADGANVVQLTDNTVHDEGPAWSPDGRLIAFTRATTEGDPGDVWVMGADGGDPVQVTDTSVIEESPDWQPIPFTAGSEAEPRHACGDLSLVPGGVASVVAVKQGCDVALDVAAEWQAGARLGAPPAKLRGFDCAAAPHSFDQQLVQCAHRGPKKAVAFVYRGLSAAAG
jgi:TolB protein